MNKFLKRPSDFCTTLIKMVLVEHSAIKLQTFTWEKSKTKILVYKKATINKKKERKKARAKPFTDLL